MPKPLLTLLLITALSTCGLAQNRLDGTWEGVMTVGGIYSDRALPMQLFLRTNEQRRVEGRSFVQLPDGTTLQMDLEGVLHGDQSITLKEVKFVGDPRNPVIPEFNRQYQIVFKDDLWSPLLNGYWQEESEETFGVKRRRGRMKLTRRKTKGV